jgi:hypothetical protein
MGYDEFLDRCHEEWTDSLGDELEDGMCKECLIEVEDCVCEIEEDDWDADDYEVCFDHETGNLEVVR